MPVQLPLYSLPTYPLHPHQSSHRPPITVGRLSLSLSHTHTPTYTPPPTHTHSLIQICSGRFQPHHACSTALIQLAHLPTLHRPIRTHTPPVTGRRHLHNFMPAGRRLMYLGRVSSPLSHCCAVRAGSHVTRVSGYRSSWKYSICDAHAHLYHFGSPFSSKVVVCGHCLVTLSLTIMKH